MASIRNEFTIEAAPDFVWDAVRDIGALHTRLVPGFVVNTVIEENPPADPALTGSATSQGGRPGSATPILSRVVTFGNGNVARELIVDLDDAQRRLAWAIVGGPRLIFYSASFQVFSDGENRTRCVWSADLLPNEMAAPVKAMILNSCATMKKTMEGAVGGR